MENESSFQQMVLKNMIYACNIMKIEPFLTLYTKTNSKCIKDLSTKGKTIKHLKEKCKRTSCF